jgi:hypothetical protein
VVLDPGGFGAFSEIGSVVGSEIGLTIYSRVIRVLPSVAWELALSTAVLRAVDKGDAHTEKALDSLPSRSSSIIASSKSWNRRKGWYCEEEGKEAKGEVRYQKISVCPFGKLISYY